AMAEAWAEHGAAEGLDVIMQVGANCLADSRALAAHAEGLKVRAVSAVAPSYHKARTVDALVECSLRVAEAAPTTPFYYYEIPSFTGIAIPTTAYLEAALERIPTFVGLKFSCPDLMLLQEVLSVGDGALDVLFGVDEQLLAALTLGVQGAIGATYNFAAPVFERILEAYAAGAVEGARAQQLLTVRMVRIILRYGVVPATKAIMEMIGVPVGPPRLPNVPMSPDELAEMERDLRMIGFFEHIAR
ncbi:MAG: dihydrodipicolinate synthase family protein, partial [Armatimonadetes bacterium]|nr:dihydrodipicolinate synthase family protein [Armatimonadota bacterium]